MYYGGKMENKKVIKKMVLITIFSLIILFLLQFIYLVPESHYSILDQTGKVELKDYPELKVIGTIEINRSINDLKDFAEPYIDEKSEEKIIRKTYPLQKEFLRILGRNAEIYNSLGDGMFYLNIYIKDLKTNKIFVINRNKIFIDFESAGPKVFIPNI